MLLEHGLAVMIMVVYEQIVIKHFKLVSADEHK